MGFFSAPYEIVAADVATAGPRHYLTRAAFQRSAWEDVLADVRFAAPDQLDELDAVEWLARESYLRVFGPVAVGELVGVLLSFDERGDSSSVRLYLRVVRRTGEPVACALLTMSSISKATGSPVSLPSAVVEYLRTRSDERERIELHAFADATSTVSLDVVFPEEVRSVGALVASRWPSGRRRTTAPRRPVIATAADERVGPPSIAARLPTAEERSDVRR